MEGALTRGISIIYRALLKNGHSNFSLTILEYCEPEKCLEREGYYQKTFNPEYNIAKKPGAPMYGRKHSDKTKTIMSPSFGGMLKKVLQEKIILDLIKIIAMSLNKKYLMLCQIIHE